MNLLVLVDEGLASEIHGVFPAGETCYASNGRGIDFEGVAAYWESQCYHYLGR